VSGGACLILAAMLELHRQRDSKSISIAKLTSDLPIKQPVGFRGAWFAQSHRQVLVAAAESQVVELAAAGRRSEAVANKIQIIKLS
jgi:hypothetical protein